MHFLSPSIQTLLAQTTAAWELENRMAVRLDFGGVKSTEPAELQAVAGCLTGALRLRRAIDGAVALERAASLTASLEGGCVCDAGDEQSLTANLSTFSGHLRAILNIRLESTGESLVLLDELGTGTDPTEGTALSVAIIKALAKDGFGGSRLLIATTHHGQPSLTCHLGQPWLCLTTSVFEDVEHALRMIIRIDSIVARARYSTWIGGVRPEIVSNQVLDPPSAEDAGPPLEEAMLIDIRKLQHPLLLAASFQDKTAAPVPVDILVERHTRAVAITGPNTGGKTAVMKALGLVVLMSRAGLYIPALEARLPWFDKVLADIGAMLVEPMAAVALNNNLQEAEEAVAAAELALCWMLTDQLNQVDNIAVVIDEDGKIRSNASPDLRNARRKRDAALSKVMNVLRASKGEIAKHGGRLVVAVVTDKKDRNLGGLVVGTTAG
eukprot:gene6400-7665_t